MRDDEIESLVRAFGDGSLPRREWTHQAHLLVALWYLLRYPTEEATDRIRGGIRRYNASLGNHSGYHETVTLAWIAVVGRFLDRRGRTSPVSTLAGALLEQCGAKDYLLRFYSRGRLDSEEARSRWVPPDRAEIG